MRRSELKRTSTLRRRTMLRPMSDKQRERQARLREVAEKIGPVAKCEAMLPGCTKWADDLHHIKPRSLTSDDSRENLLVVCRRCHSYIEDHPAEARRLGLLKRSTDD